MRHFERNGNETILLVGKTVDAGALSGHGKPRARGDDVVRRELKLIRDRQAQHVLPRTQRQMGESNLDLTCAFDYSYWPIGLLSYWPIGL